MQETFKQMSDKYKTVAIRGQVIFFIVDNLYQLNNMY